MNQQFSSGIDGAAYSPDQLLCLLSTLLPIVAEEEESLRDWCKDINDVNSLDVHHRNHRRFLIKDQVNTALYLEYIFALFFF